MGDSYARGMRELPSDVELEQELLGACMVDNSNIDIAQEVLDAEHFYDPMHQRLFEMMGVLRADGDDVTPKFLNAVMKHDPGMVTMAKLPIGSGLNYLFGMMDMAAIGRTPVRQYSLKIKEFYERRRIIEVSTGAADKAFEGLDLHTTSAILDTAIDEFGTLSAGSKTGRRHRPKRLVDAIYELGGRIEERAKTGKRHGVLTGINFIDTNLGGLIPGHLLFAGGRPGMGKSQLATNIARNVAMQGMETDYWCPEMDNDQLAARIACEVDYDRCGGAYQPMPYKDFVQLHANLEMRERLSDAQLRIQEWAEIELFTGGMTLERLEATSRRRARQRPGHRLLVVDHLQLVHVENLRRGANRTEEQRIITGRLKELAQELDWTILVLSQLSREIESRDDKRPRMQDFREGGSIEEDADGIIGLVRLIRYAGEKIKQAKSEEQRTVALGEYDALIGVLSIAVLKARAGSEADYHDVFIDEKSSAIRNERGATTMFEAELPF